jgi:cation:H+ antiporter
MLATLAFAVTGLSAIGFRRVRPEGIQLKVCTETLSQDFAYFFVVYVIAIGVSPVLMAMGGREGTPAAAERAVRIGVAILLVVAYAVYVKRHLARVDEDEGEDDQLAPLYFQRGLDLQPRLRFVFAQILVALVAIIAGAHIFVKSLEHVAAMLAISPLVLSIVVTPIATELPEKFNSLLWVRRGKDTLALGNISGAMVFQSCIPVAIGIAMTRWALDLTALASAGAALLSAAVVFAYLRLKKRLDARVLLIGVPLYIAFLVVAFRAAGPQ